MEAVKYRVFSISGFQLLSPNISKNNISKIIITSWGFRKFYKHFSKNLFQSSKLWKRLSYGIQKSLKHFELFGTLR